MGNFTFSEIFTILVVILIVFGPQRLPELARKAGALASRARSAVDSLKTELDTEYGDVIAPLKEARNDMRAVTGDIKGQITAFGKEVTAAGDSIKKEVTALGKEADEATTGLKGAAEKAVNQIAASNAFSPESTESDTPSNGTVSEESAAPSDQAAAPAEETDVVDGGNG